MKQLALGQGGWGDFEDSLWSRANVILHPPRAKLTFATLRKYVFCLTCTVGYQMQGGEGRLPPYLQHDFWAWDQMSVFNKHLI